MASEQKSIQLNFRVEAGEMELLKRIIGKILNLKRISLSFLLMAVMTLMLLGGLGSGQAAAPLVMFSGCITILFLLLLFYAWATKPKLLDAVKKMQNHSGWVKFRGKEITVCSGTGPAAQVDYDALRGQYWCEDYYILYVDDKKIKTLIPVAIDENSFDDIFFLAQNLSEKKKNLVRLKMRKGRE